MWRIAIVVGAVLLTLHGLLTFVFGLAVFRGSPIDRLAFSQHGFTFLAIALLNLVTWRQPGRAKALALLVHATNLAFLTFCIVFALARPEPPLYVAASLMFVLTAAALGADLEIQRGAQGPS